MSQTFESLEQEWKDNPSSNGQRPFEASVTCLACGAFHDAVITFQSGHERYWYKMAGGWLTVECPNRAGVNDMADITEFLQDTIDRLLAGQWTLDVSRWVWIEGQGCDMCRRLEHEGHAKDCGRMATVRRAREMMNERAGGEA